jgi:hypothetical protein
MHNTLESNMSFVVSFKDYIWFDKPGTTINLFEV